MTLRLTAAALLLAAVGVAAQGRGGGAGGAGTATAQPVVLKPGPVNILGKVVEAGSTTGVAGATVSLQSPALGSPTRTFSNGTPAGSRRIVTDAQGQFVVRELPAGSYSLSATAPGYVGAIYGQRRPIQRPLELDRTLDVTESDRNVPATIEMWKYGGITGRVIDEVGDPMVGVYVTSVSRVSNSGGATLMPDRSTSTDDRGMYHFDVTPGDYLVGVLAATQTVPVASVEAFDAAMREGGPVFESFMRQAELSGILARGYGSRVRSHLVSQISQTNTPVVPPIAGNDGASFYPSAFHPSSPTTIGASVVSVGSGEEKNGIDIVLRPAPARRISGRVVGPDGAGVGNIALMLLPPEPAFHRTSPAILIDVPKALTDASGAFTFIGVAPGNYAVHVRRQPLFAGTEPALWANADVSLGDKDVADLQVRLQSGVRASGQITFEGQGPTPDPKQVALIAISFRPVPGSVAALSSWPMDRVVETSGRFTTREYIPGPYMVTVSNMPPGWIVKSVTTGGQNAIDKAFELPSSGLSDLLITLTNQISTVSGVVRDSNGAPAPGATVIVFPSDKSLWRIPGMSSRRVQTAAPSRDGRYSFRGLPPGDYLVVAADWASADFSDGTVLTKLIPSASRITIGDGGAVAQDLRALVVK